MHYPTKTRLKIWAEAEFLIPDEHPELKAKLVDESYNAQVERLVIFHIRAFDWNCPQHIPQRFTLEEFPEMALNDPGVVSEICEGK